MKSARKNLFSSPILTNSILRRRIILFGFAVLLIISATLVQTDFSFAQWMTYRDFDVPGQKNFIGYLSPGIKDVSSGTSYQFEHPHYLLLFIVILIFFPFMLFMRMVIDPDVKLKVYRYLTQWITFVIAAWGT